jgi:hypothetical protein
MLLNQKGSCQKKVPDEKRFLMNKRFLMKKSSHQKGSHQMVVQLIYILKSYKEFKEGGGGLRLKYALSLHCLDQATLLTLK